MIRGRVWKVGGLWHHQVRDGDTLLAADNGRDLGPVMQGCREDVAALRIVRQRLGYRLLPNSWQKLVWEAEHRQHIFISGWSGT